MERRTVLASIGIGLTTAAAGCLSETDATADPGSESDSESGPESDGRSLATQAESAPTAVESGATADRLIGDETLADGGLRKPVQVALTNRASETHTPALAIERNETTVLEEAFELGADAAVHVSLTDLDEYTVRATLPDAEQEETVTVGRDQFDCNATTATVAVRDDGTLESSVVSTLMACRGVVTATVERDETNSTTVGAVPGASEQESADARHGIVVHNPTAQTWTTHILLDESSDPTFDGVYALEPGATAEIELAESGEYDLDVTVLETDATDHERIGATSFDCNASTTQAELDAAGTLELATISTQVACPDDEFSE
ncbi:hypothetical protein [Natrialba asiatica]|uniref:Ig-like domain-containing protein n=1 Tax=Natrialba asiatica (strain ATCC 700177 / DSM 12278 / JCM 9576 / FERM P-10747 / NBRC 102637 / 172P1) TaxID=29540 RepID=M0AKE7_NATA1|nr:hypothetical protein [Natrialba asiatica]ELY99175.1 hypothetical protein C481_15030 [Natrialba asiatica DSM 12278]